jgi:hypothetical protein
MYGMSIQEQWLPTYMTAVEGEAEVSMGDAAEKNLVGDGAPGLTVIFG